MKSIEKYYWLLLPIVGLLCIIMPEIIAKWLPTILGSIMVLTSITDLRYGQLITIKWEREF